MDTESPVGTGKESKRIVDLAGDNDTEEGHVNKKSRSQGLKEEEEAGIQLEALVPDHPSFQVNLENPPAATTSPKTEVAILDPEDIIAATGSSWPIGRAINEIKK